MKVLSFQPASLYCNGGCGRVLRRLYEGHENDVTSFYVKLDDDEISEGLIREEFVTAFPVHKKWMRWRLRTFASYLREVLFKNITVRKVRKLAGAIPSDVLHIINHGVFSNALCTDYFLANKKLWVSFHDHYSHCSSYDDCNFLWHKAERRLVISPELGEEYKRLFGNKEYELITDGVAQEEISSPLKQVSSKSINIYFAGLLHIEYLPLFKIFAEALNAMGNRGSNIKLILRGAEEISFLKNLSFEVDYRPDFVTDVEVKAELDNADILYLPMKFSHPEFYLYSLSTKMVSYLGASGVLLYHGPENSAVLNLLKSHNASAYCTTLNVDDMLNTIDNAISNCSAYSANAKDLAERDFILSSMQKKFWQGN